MSTVGRIKVDVQLDDNLTRPLKTAENNVRKFAERSRDELGRFTISASKAWTQFGEKLGAVSQKMQATGLAMTAGATAPLVALGAKGIKAASDLNESFTKTQQVFGDAAESVVQFADKTAASLGLSEQAALDFASTFGLILQAGGNSEEAASEMSVVLSKLSADLASFYNVDVATAADKLKSGLVGEAEPLRAFGVLLSENAVKARALAMGFQETGGQLSEAAKVQARYAIILDQTRKAQGDFERTSDGLANMTRVLKAEMTNLSAELGEVLLPYAQKAVAFTQGLVEKFKALSPEAKRNAVAIAGVVAAIGPLILGLGTLAGAISNIIAAKGVLSGVFTSFGKVLATNGGLIGVVRTSLTALTGPIGIVIAAVTALFIAWQTNFLGIQDIVMPFVRRIGAMFRDLYDNISETMEMIVGMVVDFWKSIEPEVRPVLDFLVKLVQGQWTAQLTAIEGVLRFIIDAVNTSLATIQLISGRGWSQISDSMKASFMRMRQIAWTIMASVAEAVLTAFKALTAIAGVVPGLRDVYNGLIGQAQGWIDSMKAEASASGALASSYQDQAEAVRKLRDAQEAAARNRQSSGNRPGPGAPGGNPGAGGGTSGGAGRTRAQELTSEIVLAMGRSVESPGSRAAAACAFFASSVIAKFTKGVTDEGGRIEWGAKNLVNVFRDRLGAAVVDAANAKPGALAFRPGSGPSGTHVGIVLGNGQVMDMNGQRDGRRNTFGISPASQWRGFMNVPDRFLDPKFQGGDVTEAFKAEFEAAAAAAEEYARKLQAVHDLQRELLVEQMKARGERLKDILSVQEFGKAYDALTDPLNRARIDAMEALEVFRQDLEAQEKERGLLRERAEARAALNRQMIETANGYRRERELMNATTEEERVRWEVTNGAYREANPLAQALLIAQARLLDQSRAAKAAENWKAFWANLFQRAKEMQEEARKSSQDKYDEYVKRLTERMLELSGAQEQLLRQDLTEQFKGLFPEIRDTNERAAAIQRAVDDIINRSRMVADAERKMGFLKDLAKSMEDVFMNALDNMFENGFRNFFADVIGGFRDMVRDIAAEMVRLQIRRAIVWGVNQVFGAGTASMASIFGGRAGGGFVHPGTPYMVGETGPEVFVPTAAGRVVPNYALQGAGGPVTNITVNVQTPNSASFRKSDAQIAAEAFGRANRARMRSGRG